ncbi:MAG: hypothetical protein JO020_26280 [Chloroflexi bacterium]|nr:hypothetical protein [Chloroflexota bacterium]
MSATATAPHVAPARWRRFAGLTWPIAPDMSAALGLAVAALAFYYPLVFLGRALVDYDAFVYFYPQRVFLAQSLLAGRIPLWDPQLFLGAPFLANPQTAVLYPPSWLFLLGPVHTVYTVQLILHTFLAAYFTYLLVRHAFGTLPMAAAIAGIAYAFGGFAVGQVGHLNQISAAAWLPAVLLAYHRFVVTRALKWLALGALALGLQLLAGHPQETYMTLIVLGIFGLVVAPWRSRWLIACAAGGVAMCTLGAALAAAQLLPTLELAPLSIRGDGINWSDAVAGSLPSYLAVRALLPPYWITVPYTEYLGYVGASSVTLALLAVLRGSARPVAFGAVLALLGLFLALGENTGLYAFAFSAVPGFDTFRVPARWLLLWEFGAAILAGVGADWVGRGAQVFLRSRWLWVRIAVLVLLLVVALTWQEFSGESFASRRTPAMFVALAGVTVLIGALPHLGRRTLAVSLLLVLTGGEVWAAANASPARQAPPAAFTDGQTVDWFRAHNVTAQERLLSLARPEYVPAAEPAVRDELSGLPSSLVDQVLVAQKWHDTLTPNVPLQFGLNTADGYDGGVLPLLRWLDLSGLVVESPRPDGVLLTRLDRVPSNRLLDLLGVRYLVTNAATPVPQGLQTVDFGDLHLLVRPETVPLSLVVFGTTRVGDEQAALARMGSPDFDPNREVVVEGSSSSSSSSTPGAAPLAVTPDVAEPEHWKAHITLTQPGFLLQREAWYPGWRARVDGADVPLQHADGLLRGVPLAAGQHDVEIYFDSPSFKRGALLSLAGMVVIIALLLWRPILRTRVQD